MSLGGERISGLRRLLRSSALRLTLLLSVIFALCMGLAISVALAMGRGEVQARFDASLRALAQNARLDDWRGGTATLILRAPDDLGALPRSFAAVAARGGGTVDLRDDFRGAETWRLVVARDGQGAPVVVAAPFEDSDDTLEVVAGILWSTTLLAILLALGIGLVTGVLAQRRVARISDMLNRMEGGDLAARVRVARSRDDLDDIAQQLDSAAAALERLVAQTRHLSASIAHDLRTPLARLQAHLEGLPEGAARGAALEEAARLAQMFDTIMRVARIEAAQGTGGLAPVDLRALVDDLAETFGPVIEDAGRRLIVDSRGGGTVQADRQMLMQAMANLIQNALVHGGPEVTLIAGARQIGVADTGTGVPEDQRQEILRPMVRLDAARTRDGSGLGLALVRAVADRHGAALDLSTHRPQGLRVLMQFADL